jgi:ribose transport system ATP-binding protein
MNLLLASGVSKRFGGILALDNAEFDAPAGEVHALLGENGAGKSTFIQILAGTVRADAGSIRLGGEPYRPATPRDAQAMGIATVFQELSLVPDLTVAQNIWFRHEPMTAVSRIDTRTMHARTQELLARYRFPPLRPADQVRRLSLSDRQLVEIAKALARAPSILILDEATSALAPRETEWLLALARELAASGKLVVFISHRMAEMRATADRVTVFRNGRSVGTHRVAEISDGEIIADMLGRRLDRLFPARRNSATGRTALSVRRLTLGHRLDGVDFDLGEGEVLGVAGLQGHGQRELFLALFGLVRASGQIAIWGRPMAVRSPRHALSPEVGIALVPEDRRQQGLLASKSVRENLSLAVLRRFSRGGLLQAATERSLVERMVSFLRIRAANAEQAAGTLSGGNQQKVVFGKMLLTDARILLLFDPTRGVDVGTKGEILQLMRDLAAKGHAILFYSTDLQELVHVADRVAVMRSGRIVAVLEGEVLSEHRILHAAMAEAVP